MDLDERINDVVDYNSDPRAQAEAIKQLIRDVLDAVTPVTQDWIKDGPNEWYGAGYDAAIVDIQAKRQELGL